MKKNNILRPAIAMIELIFAIVIMGIVMMSAPQLISTAASSGYVTIQQEAINEASSQVSMIMSYPWDEQNANLAVTPVILTVTNGNAGLRPLLPLAPAAPDRRAGTSMQTQRKFIAGTGLLRAASAVLGLEAGEAAGAEDDMDDFNNATNLVQLGVTPADNIQKTNAVTIRRALQYNVDNVATYNTPNINFTAFNQGALLGAQTANIKEIAVNIQSTDAGAANEVTELAKNITLRAFACNIGSYKLEER